MNEDLEELATAYVLDELEPAARAEFEARLAHDAELTALVRDLEHALAARVGALPPQRPRATLLREIEARIGGPLAERRGLAPRHAFGWGLLGGLAAVVLVGVGFTVFQSLHRTATPEHQRPTIVVVGLGSGRTSSARVPLNTTASNPDARFILLASLAEQYWEKPEKLPVAITPSPRSGRGYAVFDPGTNQGFLAVQHVPLLRAGQRYHLWLVDTATGSVRDAGVLPLDASTRGLFSFSLPGAPEKSGAQTGFFITVENSDFGAAAVPHGQVVLGKKPI